MFTRCNTCRRLVLVPPTIIPTVLGAVDPRFSFVGKSRSVRCSNCVRDALRGLVRLRIITL